MSDNISREAMVNAIDETTWYSINRIGKLTEGASNEEEAYYKATDIYRAINELPSAEPLQHDDHYTDMLNELLSLEEKTDYFCLTTRERRDFQLYIQERMEL